jgi:hypothetical protein
MRSLVHAQFGCEGQTACVVLASHPCHRLAICPRPAISNVFLAVAQVHPLAKSEIFGKVASFYSFSPVLQPDKSEKANRQSSDAVPFHRLIVKKK